jgi:hypothetical protein
LRGIIVVGYYNKIIEVLKAGEILDAQKYFEKYKKERLLSQEEIERLDKLILDWGAIIVQECLADPQITYNLYKTLQRVTEWDDKTLSEQINISKKSLKDIQNFKLMSRKVIQDMVIGLYRYLKII